MQNPVLVILAVLALGAAYVVLPVVADAYRRYRGLKRPVCPETGEPADVTLDLRHAGISAAFGRTDLHVATCSRWPERRGCAEGCTQGIEQSAPA